MKPRSDTHPEQEQDIQDVIELCTKVQNDPNFIPPDETPEETAAIEADATACAKERQEAGLKETPRETLVQVARLRHIDNKRAARVATLKAETEAAKASVMLTRRFVILSALLAVTGVTAYTQLLQEAGTDKTPGNAEKCDFFRNPIRDGDYSNSLREGFSERAAAACDSLIFDDFIKTLHELHERNLNERASSDKTTFHLPLGI